ncbi:hypothetical protein F4810DRAFT_664 [Camillea tinctor]|nr:hypothetical protein F4810DRAFT_664 [Camillea tinctor]
MSSSDLPANVASTLQSAHIQPSPSPAHDLNPSTAASTRRPVKQHRYADPSDDGLDYDDEEEGDDVDVPLSVLRRPHGKSHERGRGGGSFPPMPDLRFEQSYLHSIRGADTWWKVVWVTVRDQVMMPFAQGILYNLAICGFQHWNRNAQLSGNSAGARIRRWWYGVNKWALPEKARAKAKTS